MQSRYSFNTNSNHQQCHIARLVFFYGRFSEELIKLGIDPTTWWWITTPPFDTSLANFAINDSLTWSQYSQLYDQLHQEFLTKFPLLEVFVSSQGLYDDYRVANWPLRTRKKYFQRVKIVTTGDLLKRIEATRNSTRGEAIESRINTMTRGSAWKTLAKEGALLTSTEIVKGAEAELNQFYETVKQSGIRLQITNPGRAVELQLSPLNIDLSSTKPEHLSSEVGRILQGHIHNAVKQLETALMDNLFENLQLEIDQRRIPLDNLKQIFPNLSIDNHTSGTGELLSLLRKYKTMKTTNMSVEKALTSSSSLVRLLGKMYCDEA